MSLEKLGPLIISNNTVLQGVKNKGYYSRFKTWSVQALNSTSKAGCAEKTAKLFLKTVGILLSIVLAIPTFGLSLYLLHSFSKEEAKLAIGKKKKKHSKSISSSVSSRSPTSQTKTLQDLRKANQTLQTQVMQAEEKARNANLKTTNAEKQVQNLRLQLEQLQKAPPPSAPPSGSENISELQKRLQDAEKNYRDLQDQARIANELYEKKTKELTNQIENLSDQIKTLQQAGEGKDTVALNQLQEELKAAKLSIAQQTQKNKLLEKQANLSKEQVEQLEKDLLAAKTNVAAVVDREKTTLAQQHQTAIADFQTKLNQAEQEVAQLRTQMQQLTNTAEKNTQASIKAVELQQQLTQKTNEFDQINVQLTALREKHDKTLNALETANTKNNNLEVQIPNLLDQRAKETREALENTTIKDLRDEVLIAKQKEEAAEKKVLAVTTQKDLEITLLKDQLASLRQTNQLSGDEKDKQITALLQKVNDAELQKQAAERGAQEAEAVTQEKLKELEQFKVLNQNLETQLQTKEEALKTNSVATQALELKLQQQEEALQKASEEMQHLRAEVHKTNENLQKATFKIQEIIKNRGDLVDLLDEYTLKMPKALERLKMANEKIDRLEAHNAKLKKQAVTTSMSQSLLGLSFLSPTPSSEKTDITDSILITKPIPKSILNLEDFNDLSSNDSHTNFSSPPTLTQKIALSQGKLPPAISDAYFQLHQNIPSTDLLNVAFDDQGKLKQIHSKSILHSLEESKKLIKILLDKFEEEEKKTNSKDSSEPNQTVVPPIPPPPPPGPPPPAADPVVAIKFPALKRHKHEDESDLNKIVQNAPGQEALKQRNQISKPIDELTKDEFDALLIQLKNVTFCQALTASDVDQIQATIKIEKWDKEEILRRRIKQFQSNSKKELNDSIRKGMQLKSSLSFKNPEYMNDEEFEALKAKLAADDDYISSLKDAEYKAIKACSRVSRDLIARISQKRAETVILSSKAFNWEMMQRRKAIEDSEDSSSDWDD